MTKGFYQYGNDPEEVMLSVKLDAEDKVDSYCFLHGLCTIFALELHQEFGYPIYMLYSVDDEPVLDSLIHVFCQVEDGAGIRHFIDARGVTDSEEAVIRSFGEWYSAPAFKEVAPEELERLNFADMGNCICDYYRGCARELINRFREYYKI